MEKKQTLQIILIVGALVLLGIFFLQEQNGVAPGGAGDLLHATSTVEMLGPSEKETGATSSAGGIVVSFPRFGEEITKTFALEGRSRQSLGRALTIRLIASESKAMLFVGSVITNAEREAEFAYFFKNVPLPAGLIDGLSMTLEISPRDGNDKETVLIPLVYKRIAQSVGG